MPRSTARQPSAAPGRRRALRLASLAAGLLVGLGFAEAALRLLERNPPSPPPVRHLYHDGLDRAYIQRWGREDASGPRLLVAGDSFTFGAGVGERDAYPYLLAQELSARDVEIVSYSRPGWNTRALRRALTRDFDAAAPDLFILGFCLNDVEPYSTARMLAQRPDLQPWKPRAGLESRLAATSALYSRSRRAMDALRLRPRLRAYYRDLYEDPENMAVWRRALAGIHRLTAQRRIPALLVVFPIFDSDIDSDYAHGELHERVLATATELGFDVLDLRAAYAGVRGRELAVAPFTDPHPNRLAHEIAARTIARHLEASGLLETREPDLSFNRRGDRYRVR